MPMYGGYAGKVAIIDLSSKTISDYPWSAEERLQHVGGKSMAIRILRDHLTGKETAFSMDNWIVIATGPLTGTGAPGSARFDIAALSPKDDFPAFSNCGGDFGVYLKRSGYDALILAGQSQEECWLEINEDTVIFHNAKQLWGTGTGVCREKLAEFLEMGGFGSICIGPAGENLVKFASIVSDGHAAGRAGIGAVFGWKKVKAITVSGNKQIPVYDPESAGIWNRKWYAFLKGTHQNREAETGKFYCPGCPLHCRKHSPEDMDTLLNELGMDAIAAKDAVSWAEREGILTEGLYEKIAFRRNVADRFAEGIPGMGKKGGKRRGGSHRRIAEAFGFSEDDQETGRFCRALTEMVSIAGQCMFTMNALPKEEPLCYFRNLVFCVTGWQPDLDELIRIGQRSLDMEQQLRESFQ